MLNIWFSSVQFNHSFMSYSLRPHESQHDRPPCPSPPPRVYSNTCPLSQWCHPTISSSVIPFSSSQITSRYKSKEGNGTPLQYSCLENPWTEEPGRLQSMGSLGVRHDWATSLSLFTFMHWRRKWQPTPVFLPGASQGRGAWWASVYGVTQSRTQLKRLSSSSTNQKNLILSLNCIQRVKSTGWLGWPKGSFENYEHTFWPTEY